MTTRLFWALCAVLALAACNTMEGMGRDVSTAGQTITGTADDAQDDMSGGM
jgi:predicted small secreted protein